MLGLWIQWGLFAHSALTTAAAVNRVVSTNPIDTLAANELSKRDLALSSSATSGNVATNSSSTIEVPESSTATNFPLSASAKDSNAINNGSTGSNLSPPGPEYYDWKFDTVVEIRIPMYPTEVTRGTLNNFLSDVQDDLAFRPAETELARRRYSFTERGTRIQFLLETATPFPVPGGRRITYGDVGDLVAKVLVPYVTDRAAQGLPLYWFALRIKPRYNPSGLVARGWTGPEPDAAAASASRKQ